MFLTFHNINQSGALLKSMWVQSVPVCLPHSDIQPYFLQHTSGLSFLIPVPPGRITVPPFFPCSLVLPGFHCAREPCWVLPSSEPLSRLHPAHNLSSPFFLLGKEITGVPKAGLWGGFSQPLCPNSLPACSLREGYQPLSCASSAAFDRKERRKAVKFPGFYFRPFHRWKKKKNKNPQPNNKPEPHKTSWTSWQKSYCCPVGLW